MSSEILINPTGRETRVALLEKGQLVELHIDRGRNRGFVGNVYLGKVVRVLPGIQAAFVDIGLEKAAFLYAGDIHAPSLSEPLQAPRREPLQQEASRAAPQRATPSSRTC